MYYVAHIETVPYTHRRHVVLVSPATERSLGAQTFKQVRPAPLGAQVIGNHLRHGRLPQGSHTALVAA